MKNFLRTTCIVLFASSTIHTQGQNICDDFVSFDASRVKALVSGDFDRDGDEDDVLACYDHGGQNTTFYVWKSNGTKMLFDWGWYSSNQFNANNIKGKFVSGDFNGDGIKDDIAAIYDYGAGNAKAHVWFSNGTSMVYQGTWWSNNGGYPLAHKFSGRVVSGDFDEDGKHDDIALFYYKGYNLTEIRVLKGFKSSNSSYSFVSQPYWYSNNQVNFNATKITDRVVSGDFDNDGYHDDILAHYDHGGNTTKTYNWKSVGNYMTFGWHWYNSNQYNGNQIKGRVVSADFDGDGKHDDVAAFYDYGSNQTRIHYWQSNGGSPLSGAWTSYNSGQGMFNANGITDRVVSGDFDKNGKNDNIITMYNYTPYKTSLFMWKKIGTQTIAYYQNAWTSCGNKSRRSANTGQDVTNSLEKEKQSISDIENTMRLYPNPTQNSFKIEFTIKQETEAEIYDYTGKKIKQVKLTDITTEVDMSDQPKGIYMIYMQIENKRISKKLIIE